MADATFSDVVKAQQETNEILRQQAIADGKPDPLKFIKEEFVAIAAQRSYAKKDRGLQTKTAKTVESSEKTDQGYYKKQLKEQTDTTGEQVKTTKSQEETTSYLKIVSEGVKGLPLTLGKSINQSKSVSFLRKFFTQQEKPKLGTAKDTETERKSIFDRKKTLSFLGSIAKSTGGLFKSFGGAILGTVKGATKGLFSFLTGMLGAGLALGALAFLQSGKFDSLLKFIKTKVIPVIGPLLDNIKVFVTEVIVALGDFFNGKDMKDIMKSFRDGKGVDALMKLGDAIGKGIFNFVAGIFDFEKIGKNSSFSSKMKEMFNKSIAGLHNMFVDTVNSFMDAYPKIFMFTERLNRFDPHTGKEILTDAQAETKTRIAASPEVAAANKAIAEAGPELARLQKTVEYFKSIDGREDTFTGPTKLEMAQGRLEMFEEELADNLEKAEEKIRKQVFKTDRLSSESIVKNIYDMSNLRGAAGNRGLIDPLFAKAIESQGKLLERAQRKKSEDQEMMGNELTVDVIKRLEKTIEELKFAKQQSINLLSNTTAINTDQSVTYTPNLIQMDNPQSSINLLGASVGGFRG